VPRGTDKERDSTRTLALSSGCDSLFNSETLINRAVVEIVAAPVLVDKAIRITGSVDDGVDEFLPAVLTTELLSVGQRFAPSLDERSAGV